MRVGRGIGSGKGKTCGRGVKGQKSRTGVRLKGFEGGQMPLYRRLPKRGFNNPFRQRFAEVNLGKVQKWLDDGRLDPLQPIDGKVLVAVGLARRERVRLLAKGEIKAALVFLVHGFSVAAAAAVKAVGGQIQQVAEPRRKPSLKMLQQDQSIIKNQSVLGQ